MINEEPVLSALIIDDDEAMRKLIRIFVEEAGFQVTEAVDGDEAIDLLSNDQDFDLVITDILMPKANGNEVIKKVRETSNKTRIIAVSGGNMVYADTYLEIAESLGADYVFNKPIDFTMMRNVFQSIKQ